MFQKRRDQSFSDRRAKLKFPAQRAHPDQPRSFRPSQRANPHRRSDRLRQHLRRLEPVFPRHSRLRLSQTSFASSPIVGEIDTATVRPSASQRLPASRAAERPCPSSSWSAKMRTRRTAGGRVSLEIPSADKAATPEAQLKMRIPDSALSMPSAMRASLVASVSPNHTPPPIVLPPAANKRALSPSGALPLPSSSKNVWWVVISAPSASATSANIAGHFALDSQCHRAGEERSERA